MADENILTPEEREEAEVLAQQMRRNRIFGVILGVLVFLIILATMYMIAVVGFVPLDNADIFRSA